ncbi:HAD family hydrolase [Haloarcula litorea]|uniref:HAD family hydrolase n=1 Tax=Haloarcula litorea TaxID=3032579 RepID=UPI0023E79E61|nr:HAD family hydrolase [Halomicroarcula sp. GDY20]
MSGATTALCLDLDGTLVHLTRPYSELVLDTFAEHGLPRDPELEAFADERFAEAFAAMDPDAHETAFAAVVERAGADADPAAMAETLREIEYEAGTVPGAARDSLETLAADNALAVVTNGTRDWQLGKLDHHGLTDLFDAVVASYEAGAHKPDAAVFDLVRERVPADEYVMVGDDYEADVEGARAAGFVPIHYERGDGDGPGLWSTVDALL